MTETVITFGADHDVAHRHIAPAIHEGYVVIEAPTREQGRDIAFVLFEDKWAFDYDIERFEESNRRSGYYPAGELLRVAWISEARRNELAAALDETYGSDFWGESMDQQHQNLRVVRDLLAQLIHYTPEEAS